ncbi:MAG: Mov34/MPN/PAD-1 family protein [Armatimonadota bacterium]
MSQAQVDAMIEHAQAEYPNECCGLLAGVGTRVAHLFRGRNIDQSPFTYRLDPHEQLQFFKDIDARGLELLGIYHSHTRSAPYPSRTDVGKAHYPDVAYVIVSLQDRNAPLVRAYRIVKGQNGEQAILDEELAVV